MNVSELIAQVRDHGFGTGVNGISDSRIVSWINDAYMQLATDCPGPWLQSTALVTVAAGSETGTLPADCTTVKTVRLQGSGKLGRLPFEDYMELTDDGEPNTDPTHYSLWGNSIYIWPRSQPGAVPLTVFYWKRPAALGGDGAETPQLPANLHRLIVLGAVVLGFRQLDDTEQENLYFQQYTAGVEKAAAALSREDADRSSGSSEWTLGAMRQKVRDAGFDLGDPTLTGSINDAYLDVSSRYNWPWLVDKTTVTVHAGEAEVSLPTNCARPIALISDKGERLNYQDLDERFTADPGSWDETRRGEPQIYSLAGVREARLFPVPTRATSYTLWYLKEPALLSASTDRPVLPNNRHMMVFVLGACVHAANTSARPGETGTGVQMRMNQAESYQRQFEDRIELMRRDFLTNQVDANSHVLHISDPYSDEY